MIRVSTDVARMAARQEKDPLFYARHDDAVLRPASVRRGDEQRLYSIRAEPWQVAKPGDTSVLGASTIDTVWEMASVSNEFGGGIVEAGAVAAEAWGKEATRVRDALQLTVAQYKQSRVDYLRKKDLATWAKTYAAEIERVLGETRRLQVPRTKLSIRLTKESDRLSRGMARSGASRRPEEAAKRIGDLLGDEIQVNKSQLQVFERLSAIGTVITTLEVSADVFHTARLSFEYWTKKITLDEFNRRVTPHAVDSAKGLVSTVGSYAVGKGLVLCIGASMLGPVATVVCGVAVAGVGFYVGKAAEGLIDQHVRNVLVPVAGPP